MSMLAGVRNTARVLSIAVLLSSPATWAQTPGQTPPQSQTLPGAGVDLGSQVPGLKRRPDGEDPAATLTLKTSARLVVLDVVVTDGKGHSVTGLKQSDFTLHEDNGQQKVVNFIEHGPLDEAQAVNAIAASKLPRNIFTNDSPSARGSASTIILMDALDTNVQSQMYLRDQVIQFMKTVQPGTQMAVFQLDMRLHLLQGMTTDPDILRAAVNSKRDQPAMTPLGATRGGNYAQQQFKIEILTGAMHDLGQYLSAFPGRKNLIWFTGGIPISLYGPDPQNPFADQTQQLEQFGKMTDTLTLNRIAVYPIDARGLRTDPQFSAANRGIGSPLAPRAFGTATGLQNGYLDDIANKTGGKAFYNSNGLKEAIAEIVDTGTHYYTLSYEPTNKLNDGKFRKLKVEVDKTDTRLEYRHGYFALENPPEPATAMRPATPGSLEADGTPVATETMDERQQHTTLESAMIPGSAPAKSILFVTAVNPRGDVIKDAKGAPAPQGNYLDPEIRSKGYRLYEIRYSVDVRPMHFMPTVDGMYHDKLEFVAEVYDDQGKRLNGIIDKIQIDLPKANYQSALQHGIAGSQHIAMPAKGNYFLRLGVHDLNGNIVGSIEIPSESILPAVPTPAPTK